MGKYYNVAANAGGEGWGEEEGLWGEKGKLVLTYSLNRLRGACQKKNVTNCGKSL